MSDTPQQNAAEEIALRDISQSLRTQDNRITENPMFCVQTKRRDVVPEGFSCDSVWVLDGDEVDEGTEGAEEYCIRERWETVMVAFTEDGCKEYLRQNGHNLSEPRIYVESFNRCPEMIAIRRWLLSLPDPTALTKERDSREAMKFPSDEKDTLIEVFFQNGDPSFICGAIGRVTYNTLSEIEDELPEFEDKLNRGDGNYLIRPYWVSAQTDELGRVELPAYWELTIVGFRAALQPAQPKTENS